MSLPVSALPYRRLALYGYCRTLLRKRAAGHAAFETSKTLWAADLCRLGHNQPGHRVSGRLCPLVELNLQALSAGNFGPARKGAPVSGALHAFKRPGLSAACGVHFRLPASVQTPDELPCMPYAKCRRAEDLFARRNPSLGRSGRGGQIYVTRHQRISRADCPALRHAYRVAAQGTVYSGQALRSLRGLRDSLKL